MYNFRDDFFCFTQLLGTWNFSQPPFLVIGELPKSTSAKTWCALVVRIISRSGDAGSVFWTIALNRPGGSCSGRGWFQGPKPSWKLGQNDLKINIWEIYSQAVSVHCLTSPFRSWYLIWPNRSTLSQLLEFHAWGNQFDMENLCRKSFIYRKWWRKFLPSTAARVRVIMESYDPTTSKASHCTCYRTYTQPVSSHSKPIKTQIVSRLVDLGENKHESLTCKHV